MENPNIHIVTENPKRLRLADYLINVFPTYPTKSSLKKIIKKNKVLINGEIARTADLPRPQDIIELKADKEIHAKIFKLKIPVIYEDDDIALVNKPPGLVVSGNKHKTLVNALPFNLKKSMREDALPAPLPVHRLDVATSGLLLIAKSKTAQLNLSEQFKNRKITKKYEALVVGKITGEGIFNSDIESRPAITHYKAVATIPSLQNEYLTRIELYPQTGRTHQLRIHCAGAGHPIVGDSLYGTKGHILKSKGLFLAAVYLKFKHPTSEKIIEISINSPEKFQTFWEREQRRWAKFKG